MSKANVPGDGTNPEGEAAAGEASQAEAAASEVPQEVAPAEGGEGGEAIPEATAEASAAEAEAETAAGSTAEGVAGSQTGSQVAGTPSGTAATASKSATSKSAVKSKSATSKTSKTEGAPIIPVIPSKPKKKHRSGSRKRGDLDLAEAKIGFIGAGKMTEAIVEGLTEFGQIQANQIHVATPSGKNMEHFKTKGIKTCKRSLEIFSRYDCDIIFLCFHGRVIKECYKGTPDKPRAFCVNYIPYMKHPLYILSLVSHCSSDEVIKAMVNPDHPDKYKIEFHRIMINASCAYGLGVCAIDCEPDGKHLSAPLRTLLSRIAKLEYVPKDQMDAACATGGYGLAFAYYFISAMADGAFKVGLTREMAIRFAAKTSQCGALTLLESGVHPDQLRDSVIAPGGAAIEGIHSLDKTDFSFAVTSAIEAAFNKEKELADVL